MGIAFSGLTNFAADWTNAYLKGVGKDAMLGVGNKLWSNEAIQKIGDNGLPEGNLFDSIKFAADKRIANSPELLKKLGTEVKDEQHPKGGYRKIGNIDRLKSMFYHAYGKDAGKISYMRAGAAGIAGSYLAYRALS